MRLPRLLPLAVALTAVASLSAQQDAAKAVDDQLGRIFEANEYAVPRFGPARWRPDGVSYARVEPSATAGGGFDIVRYDAATGARAVLVGATPPDPRPGSPSALAIDDYAWSADGARLLDLHQHEEGLARRTRAATTGCSTSRAAR